jgi:hypothetical protein
VLIARTGPAIFRIGYGVGGSSLNVKVHPCDALSYREKLIPEIRNAVAAVTSTSVRNINPSWLMIAKT